MSKLLNDKDFFICTGGMMPTQMQSLQKVAMKKDVTKFLVKIDTATSPIMDFSCKKLMLLMAIIAVVVCALTIATGGMALIAAAAIGGLIGAAVGSLICGHVGAIARTWIGYKNDFKIVGIETLTDGAYMKCAIFQEEIRIAPFIKNWWQAAAVGLTNFTGEMFKCVMVGAAAAGAAVLATEGVGAFLANAASNYLMTWTTGWGLGLRGTMGVMDGVNQKYIIGKSTEEAFGSGTLNAFMGMEKGTANSAYNVATGQGNFEDYTGLLGWGAPIPKGNGETRGPGPETDHMGSNIWEGKPRRGKTGFKESPRMSRAEMQAYRKSMNEQGIEVVVDKKGKLGDDKRAAFDNQTGTIYLKKGATEYEAFHEQQHAEQWREMGKEAYNKQSRWQKEQYVYDQIMKNRENFSDAELDHAKKYIDSERAKVGLDPMPLDFMEGKGKDGDLFEDGANSKNDKVTNDPVVIAVRKQAAIDFYKKHNPNLTSLEIESHIAGIDFTKPIEIVRIPPDGLGPKGNELHQFTKVNSEGKALRGQYYTDNPKNTPSELGVSDKYTIRDSEWKSTNEIGTVKQEKIIFDESKQVEGLKSTSAEINDTWSVDGQIVPTEGGGSQIYIPKNQ
jgi:hypothetical protein